MTTTPSSKKLLAWPAAILILVLIVITELLPFLPVAGSNNETLNLGDTYIGLHFSVLPLICLLHLFWNTMGEIARARKGNRPASTASLTSTVIPTLYIVVLFFYKQPFFKPFLG